MDGSVGQVEPAFHARAIRRSFGERLVLDDLTLEVPQGCTLGLLGPNGSGKTTLLKILLGLVPLGTGEARVAGETSADLPPSVRERIGYVPQSPGQFGWLSGKAMLDYVSAFYPSFDREYAGGLVERWKVSLHTPIEKLSPGQQQRLSIVRALAPRPDLIVLDEPIGSLDPATRLAVIEELLAEQRRRPLTVIFSSHITGDLQRFCSHFAVLAGGRIVVMDRTEELRKLVKVALRGPEPAVSAQNVEAARFVRKRGEGERIFVMPSSQVASLMQSLPPECSARIEADDLETVLSEWML